MTFSRSRGLRASHLSRSVVGLAVAFVSACAAGCLEDAATGPTLTRASALSVIAATTDDTFMNSQVPDNNDGASLSIFTGVNGLGGVMRGLIRFAMPAGVAGRVTVSDVRLTMVVEALGSGAPGPATVERLQAVTEPWMQGNGFANTTGTFVIGQTCGGGILGATWNQSDCVTAPGTGTKWTSVGGTVTGLVSGQASTSGLPAGQPLTWDSASAGNAAMNADVQSWIDVPSSNHGWRISASDETTVAAAQRFFSTEAGAATAPTLSITYGCKAAFSAAGSACTTCTSAATTDCATAQLGNACNDSGPPSTTYSCTCGNAAYVPGTGGDGNPACVNKDECATNHCADAGDSSATCSDRAAPATGYDCTCSAAFTFNGVSCVNRCGSGIDPCGNGGTCTVAGLGWTCTCASGYASTGGNVPVCVDINACTPTALASCASSAAGNSCIDELPPSAGYHCNCGNAAYVARTGTNGSAACVDKDECVPNHCQDLGDSTATCTDHLAPATGYDCTCGAAFTFDGVSCLNRCGSGVDPCGNGGTCTVAGVGWTCACPAGYASSAGNMPVCGDFNACTPTALASCASSAAGNSCIDELPPSAGYHCNCGNAAYIARTGTNGSAACVDKDECVPNHCQDLGDSTATCTDHLAPATGYDCACAIGRTFDGATCVVTDAGAHDAGPDAGVANDGATDTFDAAGGGGRGGAAGDAGSGASTHVPGASSGGCGCRIGANDLGAPLPMLATAVGLFVLNNRRRRR